MKSDIRMSKISGSTKHKVSVAIRRGWRPGIGRVRDFYRRVRGASSVWVANDTSVVEIEA